MNQSMTVLIRAWLFSGVYSFSRGLRADYPKEEKPLLHTDRFLLSLVNGAMGLCPPMTAFNLYCLMKRIEIKARNVELSPEESLKLYLELNGGVCQTVL
jgi:hypothetical protein